MSATNLSTGTTPIIGDMAITGDMMAITGATVTDVTTVITAAEPEAALAAG